MPDATARFVAEDDTAGFEPALDALGPRFMVGQTAVRAVQRTWLDTDDWLVHRAGMVLENESTAAGQQLILAVAEGRDRSQPIPTIGWPAKIDAIPPGPVRAQIESVIGIRALLPTATLSARHRDLPVMNEDRKTVVRITVESSVSSDGSKLADQLSVSAVRGYQDQADRVAARLATVTGISAVHISVYEQALQACGRAFGDDVPDPVQLTASMPASNAVIAVLHGFLATVERTLDGVIADIDTEFLHDFRVAIRRSRSTLKLAGDVLEPGPAEQLSRDLKWLGDLTSPTRDLDVYILGLPDLAARLQSGHHADLDPFGKYLSARRRTEFRRLVRALRSARFRGVLDHWRSLGLLAEPSDPGPPLPQPPSLPAPARPLVNSADELAAERLTRAHRRVTKRGREIRPDSVPEYLHDLRKRCKELRYLLEIFGSLHHPPTHRAVLKDLKGLQEVLGEFQDSEVQGLAVRDFAAKMISGGSAPAPTVLAMGELAAQLSAHQHHARAEFAASFAAFDSADSRRRFRELASGGRP